MNTGMIRRAQLVAPFGVGAMSVLIDGTSVITAGLDHWYKSDDRASLVLEEYREHDWRLEARLGVKEFRLPPEYRRGNQGSDKRNVELTVPVLRFPRWHFCIYCKCLEKSELSMKQGVFCHDKSHEAKGARPRMSQVPFVLICTAGHLDDFPFDKWVHRSHKPSCGGQLRLISTGGDGLEGQRVVCDRCKAERSLRGITETTPESGGTVFSHRLSSPDDPYLCVGARPWLSDQGGICGLPMRGALRGAGNVYFPKVESSIYLPRKEGAVSDEMHELMRNTEIRSAMRSCTDSLVLKLKQRHYVVSLSVILRPYPRRASHQSLTRNSSRVTTTSSAVGRRNQDRARNPTLSSSLGRTNGAIRSSDASGKPRMMIAWPQPIPASIPISTPAWSGCARSMCSARPEH